MRKRAFRAIATTTSLLLMLAIPAQASPVHIGDVVQVVSGSQRSGGQNASVQLRFLEHDDKASAGTATTSANASDNSSTTSGDSSSSITTPLQDPGGIIQTEVTEDIGVEECECGDFTIPVAGFPKWPFIPLVGLVCLIPELCTDDECVPKPGEDANCKPVDICVTNCNPIPEPASLILFTSGIAALGASIRRRRSLKEVKDQQTTISGSK
jgi:PEP-CTERM motif